MTTLRKLLAVGASVFAMLQAPQAIAMPVTISAGQSAIFNFDFTGYTPAPPYNRFDGNWGMSGFFGDGETDHGTITFFDGLNGSGGQVFDGTWQDNSYFSGLGSGMPEFVDGILSVVFTSTAGSITIESFTAAMQTAAGDWIFYRNPDGNNHVPEPNSILLLAVSLLALAVMRRGMSSPS